MSKKTEDKDPAAAGRTTYDWDAIERAYRTGQYSNRELSRQHGPSEGAIRKQAKREEWQKDLSERVKQAVRTELVRTKVRTDDEIKEKRLTDREIVQEAAAVGVEVVRQHRNDIMQARRLYSLMVEQLLATVEARETLEDEIEIETREDKGGRRRASLVKAISLPTNATVLQSLVTTYKTVVALERQAFGLGDDDGAVDDPITAILEEVSGLTKDLRHDC